MASKAIGWFKNLSTVGKVVVLSAVGTGLLVTSGIAMAATAVQVPHTVITTHKVEVKQETKTEPIPFENQEVQDNTSANGTRKVTTQGVNGEKTIVYDVEYTDGVETKRTARPEEVTKQPVAQVTKVGTYVAPPPVAAPTNCPNGTYTNAAGNVVCSPYESNSAPSGATAQCRDGTYSFSQSRSGTCSHHGGVASWL